MSVPPQGPGQTQWLMNSPAFARCKTGRHSSRIAGALISPSLGPYRLQRRPGGACGPAAVAAPFRLIGKYLTFALTSA